MALEHRQSAPYRQQVGLSLQRSKILPWCDDQKHAFLQTRGGHVQTAAAVPAESGLGPSKGRISEEA